MDARSRRRSGGFSLLEVLIAVTIIAIMAGVAAVNLFPNLLAAKRTRAEADIENLKTAVELFKVTESRLPHESDWPTFLSEGSEKHKEPYMDTDDLVEGQPIDPWGNPYIYRRHSSSKFEIISYGEDGQPGGEEDAADISSKKKKE